MNFSSRWAVPHNWVWAPVGELADITGGGTPSAKDPMNFVDDGGVPWITPADLTGYNDAYISRGKRNLSDQGYAKSSAKLLPTGTVLFTSRAPIGYCAIASNPIATNQGFKSLTLFGGISAEYTRHYLKWSKPFLETLASGTTFLELSGSKLQKAPFPLPPLAEQKRIVAKLDTLSARSARARKDLACIDALVKRYKQAVLSKALSGELTKDYRKDSADWPKPVRLDEVADSFSYGSSAKSEKSGLVPVLRMGNIQDGELDWSDLVYSNDENEIAKYVLKSGDVLFNRTNSPALVGKTAIYQGEHKAIYAGYLIRIVAGPDLLPEYLNYALNSPEGRAFSWRVKSDGVSQSNISAAKLRGFEFSVPPLDEQKEIVSRIASAFEKIDRLTAKANRALELTDKLDEAILARAFRGELVPQYPNDEPASILLERILAERAAAPKVKRVRKTTRAKRESLQMAKSVIEVLNATDGWLEAPKLFEACGVRDGSLTEEVEEIYKQLLLLERQEKIAIEPVYDTAGEAKVTDRVRLLE